MDRPGDERADEIGDGCGRTVVGPAGACDQPQPEPNPRQLLLSDWPTDVPAPVGDLPRPQSVPAAKCTTLTARDVGKVVWVGGRPFGGESIDFDTIDMLDYQFVIEDGTGPEASLDERCKVVGMDFPQDRVLPFHIGIIAVVRVSWGAVIYLSYDGTGPPCVDFGCCTRVWPMAPTAL